MAIPRKIPFSARPALWHLVLLGALLWGGEYLRRDLWESDEARYACMSRPYSTRLAEPPVNPPDLWGARRGQGGAGSWKAV